MCAHTLLIVCTLWDSVAARLCLTEDVLLNLHPRKSPSRSSEGVQQLWSHRIKCVCPPGAGILLPRFQGTVERSGLRHCLIDPITREKNCPCLPLLSPETGA